MTGATDQSDRMFNKLVECESALIETADIAKLCTEYQSPDLRKQCGEIRRLSKSVHKLLQEVGGSNGPAR